MAGWKHCGDNFGNDLIRFKDTIDGVVVTAYVYDCDGDFVSWGVSHNGKAIADGEVSANGTTMQSEKDAWEEAKLRAQGYICAMPGYPMVFAFPAWLWSKLCMEELVKRGKKSLLEKCDRVINEFVDQNPDHPVAVNLKNSI